MYQSRVVVPHMIGTPFLRLNAYKARVGGVSPRYFFVGGANLPQEGIVHFGFRCDPHGFAQSHIGERRLPPLPYKH